LTNSAFTPQNEEVKSMIVTKKRLRPAGRYHHRSELPHLRSHRIFRRTVAALTIPCLSLRGSASDTRAVETDLAKAAGNLISAVGGRKPAY
jgi:hypothetical protein